MITVHVQQDDTPEAEAAERLSALACGYDPQIGASQNIVLHIFPSVQCFGQKIQDIDLLVMFADYRKEADLFVAPSGFSVHSFCATIEVKGHSPDAVIFEGARCSVEYNQKLHDVTGQSEQQKYSLKNYIERNLAGGKAKAPRIINLIWLTRVDATLLPKQDSNILAADASFGNFLEIVATPYNATREGLIQTFSSRKYFMDVCAIFSRRLQASNIDRRRMENITKSVLDRSKQQYADKLGQQLLVYRGRGGTGKTIRLIRLAYQAYEELGWRVLFLTYNKALVADLRRLLTLSGVKSGVGEGGISLKTIHGFIYEWLVALDMLTPGQGDFLQRYEHYKDEAVNFLSAGAISAADVEVVRARSSRELTWDLLLIDEAQDWPANERDLLYLLYGHEKVVVADGVDQFVRGVERIDWREGLQKREAQIVPLTKSLRLKASLCQAVCHFAEAMELDWKLAPIPEAHGGKVVVVVGDGLSRSFHGRIRATAVSDGNRPIDVLLCVPPGWVRELPGGRRESTVATAYRQWGWEVWDGVEPEEREAFPTSLDQFRIVQYESCRGLEGWMVVCFGLDELYDFKRKYAVTDIPDPSNMFYDLEVASEEYAKKWLMIPLTRAIDTLVVHVNSEETYVARILRQLHERYPEEVQWLTYN
jgi:hypothetical protein